MIDYRKILQLSAEGYGQREIECETFHSRHTISNVLTMSLPNLMPRWIS